MCRLFETIRIINNQFQNIEYHNYRVNHTRKILFQSVHPWNLNDLIKVPVLDQNIIYRCRFQYSREPGKIEFIPHVRRNIQKLYLTEAGKFEYPFKYSDRRALEEMKNRVPDPDISDILLVKDGLITDTSFSNIALSDKRALYTPSVPLLKGTRRQFYIDRKILIPGDIKPSDLFQYDRIILINAMMDLEDGIVIPMKNIYVI